MTTLVDAFRQQKSLLSAVHIPHAVSPCLSPADLGYACQLGMNPDYNDYNDFDDSL